MSSAQTVPARSRWIISPVWDLLFFIGTPVLCVAFILPLASIWSSVTIWMVVMSFSSFGHHLPGFLRAYGDRELFARYRVRFLLGPPLIFATFLYFSLRNLHGAELVLVFWSIWHLMMQHYGFMRIYDAKVGSTARWTSRFDFWLCLSWFAAIAIWSPEYRHNVLRGLYNTGVPFVSPALMNGLYYTITVVTFGVTAAYVIYAAVMIATGRPISLIKLALHAISMVFLYLVWVRIGDLFLGVAAWEVFHDIQYFAIVWAYNQTLVRKGHPTARLVRFLFRPRFVLIVLYLALIFGYGAINFANNYVTWETLSAVALAFLGTSTALHYYYDGFIWKVRHSRTRDALAIDASEEDSQLQQLAGWFNRLRARLGRGMLALQTSVAHGTVFLLVIGVLAAMELNRSSDSEVDVYESLASLVPDSPRSFTDLGKVYKMRGREDEALAAFQKALALQPDDPVAHNGIGLLLFENGGAEAIDEAGEHFKRALEIDPHYQDAYQSMGLLRLKQDRAEEAIHWFQKAIDLGAMDPDMTTAIAYEGLGIAYRAAGRTQDAREARRIAAEVRRESKGNGRDRTEGYVPVYRKPS